MWRQRARSLWLTQGDHNSKIFHRVFNARYRHNLIQSFHHNKEILSTHLDISNAFTTYYSNIFEHPIVPFYMLIGILFIQFVSGLPGKLRVLSMRRRLGLQCLVLVPKKHQARMDSLLFFFKDFGIL